MNLPSFVSGLRHLVADAPLLLSVVAFWVRRREQEVEAEEQWVVVVARVALGHGR